jgi:hypothetical protein
LIYYQPHQRFEKKIEIHEVSEEIKKQKKQHNKLLLEDV